MFSDFSGQNLQGRSFKGQNLTEANFNHADLRGVDFTNALLKGATFSHARSGLRYYWVIILLAFSLLLSVLSSHIFCRTGHISLKFMESESPILQSAIASALLVIFSIIIIRRGFALALVLVVIAVADISLEANITRVAIAVAGVETLMLAIAVAIGTTIAIAHGGIIPGILVVAGAIIANIDIHGEETLAGNIVEAAHFSWGLAVTFLGAYVAKQALAEDSKFAFIRLIAITLPAKLGTSFRNANLTDADFTKATLKSTDFRNANLTRTNFHLATNLDLARVSNTILIDREVRDLVVTHRGANQSYRGRNLKGANLAGADLRDADLTEADVSEATFEGAWLERVNLTKTQALTTNFKYSRLTGACLEAWNIDNTTQLDGAICDYVYLLNHQGERRPSSGEFATGEFTKLFQEVLNTVDLIFRNGIDGKAFASSWQKIQIENEGSELAIRSIENKGDGCVIVRVDIPANADKAKIHSNFIQHYDLALKALEEKYRAELNSKDEQITIYRQHQADYKELLVQLLASRPVNLRETQKEATSKSVNSKLVILKVGQGKLTQGFPITLQIGAEGSFPSVECTGVLPSAPEIIQSYGKWQSLYRRGLRTGLRLEVIETKITNFSRKEFFEACHDSAENLKEDLNRWLKSESFRSIREQLLEKLTTSDLIRVIIQTEDSKLRHLPWHLWDFFERYPKSEFALSTPAYERIEKSTSTKAKVNVLAILGDSTGIDIHKDRILLEQLPDAAVTFLVEPNRQEINDQLWAQPWDILFFAGHSCSHAQDEIGQIFINKTDSLTIPQLKHGLKKAIAQGLTLAIFNSCDGLSLAVNLADLHIPQMIVMREPVPDQVAQAFLKNFLAAFASGKPFYYSVREAREKLQGLEDECPCATWLPVICQNPAEIPGTWQDFRNAIGDS